VGQASCRAHAARRCRPVRLLVRSSHGVACICKRGAASTGGRPRFGAFDVVKVPRAQP
jgi:hypothetical protein